MAHAAIDRALDQRAGVDGVVAIIAERIAHRIRHHNRCGEVDDRFDAVFANKPCDERLVAGLTDNERHAFGNGPAMSGGKIVEHDDTFAGIDQLMHHLAADITSAAGDQDCHGLRPICQPLRPTTIW